LQQGDRKGALQAWVDLVADASADAEWLPLVRQRIAETGATLRVDPASLKTTSGMPSQAAVTATAKATADSPPEERRTMIRHVRFNTGCLRSKNGNVPGFETIRRAGRTECRPNPRGKIRRGGF
jgi:hypothetical protein